MDSRKPTPAALRLPSWSVTTQLDSATWSPSMVGTGPASRQQLRGEPGLPGGLGHVPDGHPVGADGVEVRPSTVDSLVAQPGCDRLPPRDQPLVYLVPLVLLGADRFQPVPLHDRGLDQAGRV